MEKLPDRITINPEVLHGKPSIRNMRFGVTHLLELLAAGMTYQEILDDYPYLEEADIRACLLYASKVTLGNSRNHDLIDWLDQHLLAYSTKVLI